VPTAYYPRPQLSLSIKQRHAVNTGILNLIRAQKAPDPARVFAGYTGRGGLHSLEYAAFTNRHSFTQAKQEFEQGQFFTPDEVVALAANILAPAPGAILCDPTCGHGAFFNWFTDCRLFGNDIDLDAALVARYVFPSATISNTDLRAYAPPLPCDFIVGNPPFGLRWATMDQWDHESVTSKRSEDLFLEFTARHLRRGGSAIFVVPEAWPRHEMVYADTHKLLAAHFIVEGEFLLHPAAFKEYGCEHIGTKLFLIRTKLQADEIQGPVPLLNTSGRTIEDVLGEWSLAGSQYAEFRLRASSLRARLTLDQARDVARHQDKIQAYTFHKYAYHLSRFNKTAADQAWQRWAEAHKPKPQAMRYEDWAEIRLHPETVLKETRAAVKRQNKKPLPLVRLSQTKQGLQLKGYNPSASSALAHQTKLWTWLDLEQTNPDLQPLIENLSRLNQRPDKEKIHFATFNWQKVVERNRRRLAAWRRPIDQPPNPSTLTEVVLAYQELANQYGLPVRKEPLQEEKLAQIIDKPGALLAWQQGVGKTYAALVFCRIKAQRDRASKRRTGANLIVTSSLSVHMNWLPELRKAGRHIITNKDELLTARSESWIVLTHAQAYQLRNIIRRLAKAKAITCLILDEADEYANHYSRRYRAVRTFSEKIRYRLLTTGTPVRNTAAELFNQLEIVFGGSPAFQCVAPIVVQEDKEGNLLSEDNPHYLEPYAPFRGYALFRRCHAPVKTTVLGQRRDIPEITNRQALATFLSTIRSRLTLEDLLGRDPLQPQVVNIQATPAETALYEKILKETSTFIRRELDAAALQSRKLNQLAIAHAIRILQQACSIPRKYPEFQGPNQAKLNYILGRCLHSTHHHIAIGTLWKQAAFQIANHLTTYSHNPVFVYTGEETMAKRKCLLEEFASAPRAVLITTQQALRSSVNIRCVSQVIAESLPWNFSALGQYARRFVRYDSDHPRVELQLLVTQNTIEERILGLNIRKEGIASLAAGDLLEDDVDPILDKYGVNTSTLMLLVEYLSGEKDSSLNIDHLKKQLTTTEPASHCEVQINNENYQPTAA
jgi:SAM-dependent methyltransferase